MKSSLTRLLVVVSLTSVLLISLIFTGCASTTSSSGPKIFKVANAAEAANIGYTPKMMLVTGTNKAAPAIESLYRNDAAGKAIPFLVEKEVSDVAGKNITFTLKKGIKFHDGTVFDADAVKWNLQQCIDAKVGGTQVIQSIDVIDANTFRVNLKQWDNTFISTLTQIPGAMMSPTAFKTHDEAWCMSNPVGTGPFTFVSWVKDSKAIFKKNDNYWQKGKPYVDGIEFNTIADMTTREISFRAGELDEAMWFGPKEVQKFQTDGFVILRGRAGSGALGVGPDAANPKSPWADVKVRQAGAYALNTAAIAKGIYQGEAEPANQWIYKGHWGYDPSIVGYPYNPTKAKQLLAEAGYPNGFKTKINYQPAAINGEYLYTAVQADLKAVGIDAEMVPLTPQKWFEIALGGGSWEGLMHIGMVPNPDLAAALYLSNMGGGRLYSQMLFPEESTQAIKNAVGATDFEGKVKYTQQAMKLSIDKYCNQIMFVTVPDLGVSQKYVKNAGIFESANSGWWTPEEVKLDK